MKGKQFSSMVSKRYTTLQLGFRFKILLIVSWHEKGFEVDHYINLWVNDCNCVTLKSIAQDMV